ncbi:NB-ARC domain-containing protein [Actinoplanes sp. GCM10030250]|uniref:NB-ARC domain-containing protein n=1 Tax=Actinoplanes sp. GCM10030250 TaxID=3273376 RepID=UPI0036088011
MGAGPLHGPAPRPAHRRRRRGRPQVGELAAIVGALTRRAGAATVGITTTVHGAGGFGKTTVARLVRAHPRVLRRFGGRAYWVTLGRDVRHGGLVEKINDLVRRVDPARAQPFTDVRQAADHLAAVLATGPRRLIILDDLWYADQLDAFPVGGRSARMVTTRLPSLVAGRSVAVEVDQMPVDQARRVLTADLPELPADLADGLLDETGQWPLLLRLVNKILVDQSRSRPDVAPAAAELLTQLRQAGPIRIDELSGAGNLDVNDPDQRDKAVRATIEAGTGLLSADEHTRFTELAIFAEDEDVPVSLVAGLWQATGGVTEFAARTLCARLADLALLKLTPTAGGGTISLHDVIRDYLAGLLGPARVAELHRTLLGALRDSRPGAAWWTLAAGNRYLCEHLVEHLIAAGSAFPGAEIEILVTDLRWVAVRLETSGSAGAYADLARFSSPRTARLTRTLEQLAHLLGPTEPAHSCVDVLLDRTAHDADWGPQARQMRDERRAPRLVAAWPLPDLPSTALLRTLAGRTGWKQRVGITPDGRRIITAGEGGLLVRDTVTGERIPAAGNRSVYGVLGFAPDHSCFAVNGPDDLITIWDTATLRPRTTYYGRVNGSLHAEVADGGTAVAVLTTSGAVHLFDNAGNRRLRLDRRDRTLEPVAIAPDGTWLADSHRDGSVIIWDTDSGQPRTVFRHLLTYPKSLAIARDGTWLAVGGWEGSVLITDAVTGEPRTTLTGHDGEITAMAVAACGCLATAGDDRTVRVWDVATGRQRSRMVSQSDQIDTMAFAPDGTWLAATGPDETVRVFTARAGIQETPPAESVPVHAFTMVADGTWLAAVTPTGTALRWDAATGARTALIDGEHRADGIAVPRDGSWFVTTVPDRVLIRRPGDSQPTELTGHGGSVRSVVAAPDGTWLATSGKDGSVRIWDVGTGRRRARFWCHRPPLLAVAPDSSWLVAINGGTGRLHDVATGRLTRFRSGTRWPWAVTTTPDGWLAIADLEGTIRIRDAATGRERIALTGATEHLTAIAVTPDGRRLAGSGAHGSLWLWDLDNPAPAAMTRVDSPLVGCAWSPDGRYLFTGGTSGLYRFEFHPT